MKITAILGSSFAFIFILLTGAIWEADGVHSPCDAPLIGAGYTGAPGDGTCANSGCHSGTINSGPGSLSFALGNGDSLYLPGQTFSGTVKMAQSGIDKFGFQILALTNTNNANAGTWALTDPARIIST